LCDFVSYAKQVQEALNRNEFSKIPLHNAENVWDTKRMDSTMEKDRKCFFYFEKRMASFSNLDSINEEWERYLERLKALFLEDEKGKARYEDCLLQFRSYLEEKNLEYLIEQLMVYYVFLFLARCVDDMNFWGKAQFCVSSFLMIQDMQMERFYQNGGIFTVEDCVDIARIYAKEVEHSQENLEFLEEEFLFEEIYQAEALCEQIMEAEHGKIISDKTWADGLECGK
jgi:lysine-N-methylase